MAVTYEVEYANGDKIKNINVGCFGGLKRYKGMHDFKFGTRSAPALVKVTYYIDSNAMVLMRNLPSFAPYLHPTKPAIVVSKDAGGDKMISIFSFARKMQYVVTRTSLPRATSKDIIRSAMFAELNGAMNSSHSSGVKYRPLASASNESSSFDLRRLTIGDLVAASIRLEGGLPLPDGYQPPMKDATGYVRKDVTGRKGDNVTGYWTSPANTGKMHGDLKGTSLYDVLKGLHPLDLGKFNTFMDEAIVCVKANRDAYLGDEVLQASLSAGSTDFGSPVLDTERTNIHTILTNLSRPSADA